MKTQKTRKPTEIQQPVVFRCTDKAMGKCLGYGVKSDRTSDTYHVTYNYRLHRYECTCPATCECKHIRAVKEVVEARKGREEEAAPAASYDVVAEAVAAVEAAENAALDAAYEVRGSEMAGRRPQTQPRPVGCDRCFECGHWQRGADGKYLCPECLSELAEIASRKAHATCDFCGRNHKSSTCYL